MKRSDRIKLAFIRNWILPGKERLAHFFGPSAELRSSIKSGIVTLKNEDIAIYTTADNYIEWTIISTGTYEDEINKLIRISVQPGDICLDVGGNIGLQSIRMSQAAGPEGHVYAFEPLNYLRAKLESNLKLNRIGNVTVLPYALSDKDSEQEFSVDERAWNQGTFSLNANAGTTKQMVTIKAADQIAEINALPRMNLVKIDVEGFEYHVIRGLSQAIQRHRPRIIFEYDEQYWLAAGEEIKECFEYLKACGYNVYQVEPIGCEVITAASKITGGNLFCIPV